MSGEPVALKVINKINGKLKFLYRKNRFPSPELRRMFGNALNQLHFDYACPAWYPDLTERNKKVNINYAKWTKCITYRWCVVRFGISHYLAFLWLFGRMKMRTHAFFYLPVVSICLFELAWCSNGSVKSQTLKYQSNRLGV